MKPRRATSSGASHISYEHDNPFFDVDLCHSMWVNNLGQDQDERDELVVGLKLLALLLTSQEWVHRKVDALRLDLEGSSRRFVSVDVTLPEKYRIEGSAAGRVIVPLAMLSKGAKQRLDAKHDSKSLAVLGRNDNSRFALWTLRALLSDAPRKAQVSAEHEVQILQDVVNASLESQPQALQAYNEWKRQTLDHEQMVEAERKRVLLADALASRLAAHYLLLVEVDAEIVEKRATLKYSLDQEMPDLQRRGLHRIRFQYHLPDFGFSKSQHVELEVPRGLSISTLEFVEFNSKNVAAAVNSHSPRQPARLAHTVLAPSNPLYRGFVWAHVVADRRGVYSFAKWAAWITSALVVLSIATRIFDSAILKGANLIPSPAASIVLVAPAILLSWISRDPEHELATRLLAPLRHIVLACAGILTSMAALAAVPLSPWVWNLAWAAIYAATIAMGLYSYRVYGRYGKKSVEQTTVEQKIGGTHGMV